MSMPSRSSRRAESGSGRPLLLLLVAVLLFAAGGATAWWWLKEHGTVTRQAATATPSPDFGPLTPSSLVPSPEASTAASPAAEAAPSPEASTRVASAGKPGGPPLRRPPPRPPVTVVPVNSLAQILTEAESAAAASRFAEAADLYDRALQMDPKNATALAGKARIGAMGAGRSFVLGTTVVESLRAVGRDLDGFDTKGVGVKRAPRIDGQLDLVMEPPTPKAGDAYAVKLFLKNDSKKGTIDVDEMKVSMIVDGKWSTRPLPPKLHVVAPHQRVLLEELPGIWHAGVKDWAVEAVVTSKNQDVYRNRLTWK
jgi:hypothetical protein